MAEPSTSLNRHWASLDGIRAWALIFMLFYHFGRNLPKGGFLTIDMFFVLSGFLITSLLLGEREKRGVIRFGNFYARRALRLLPCIIAVLIFVTIASLVFGQRALSHQTLTTVPFTLFYVANWVQAFGHVNQLGMLDHTWSLSLEEQFYLIWPTLLLGLLVVAKNRRRMLGVCLFFASLADMGYRAFMVHHNAGFFRVYYATDTHCDGLLMGCAIALWLASRTKPLSEKMQQLSKVAAYVGVVVLMVALFTFNPFFVSTYAVSIPIAVFATSAIIVNLVTHPARGIDLVLGSKPLVWLGKRSYGFYLWHWPFYVIVTSYWKVHANRCDVTELALACIAGTLSYKYLEEPFLRRKVRFQATESMPSSFATAAE
ncbi:MAG TPA: acyltransferase [Acidimicrobiales bacterium]|nr:acyltransferase [Acidimicrobiales bacterium]